MDLIDSDAYDGLTRIDPIRLGSTPDYAAGGSDPYRIHTVVGSDPTRIIRLGLIAAESDIHTVVDPIRIGSDPPAVCIIV